MGGKGSKDGGKNSKVPAKQAALNKKDIEFLTKSSGMSKEAIEALFKQFNADNPDGKLDRAEFAKLYPKMRNEPVANLDEISNFVFTAFDSDNNGFLTFNEFLIGYAVTSKGDLKTKLEYGFELYDADNNGYLSEDELKQVITGMLDLLGADKAQAAAVAKECMKELDKSGDKKVSKDEFVKGLMASYSLRAIMSPFS